MHQSTRALRARLANRYALRQRFMHGVRAHQVKAQSTKRWQKIERAERMRAIRVWCLTLGGVIMLLPLSMLIGSGGVGNPKTASSIFAALQANGMLRDIAAPTALLGLCLVIIGLLASVVVGRNHEP